MDDKKPGYEIVFHLRSEKKDIFHLRDMIMDLLNHFVSVDSVDVDGEEVYNVDEGGFYTKPQTEEQDSNIPK